MGRQLEKSFEKHFLKELKKLPNVYIPAKQDSPSVRGLADRTVCINGKYIHLEFKRSLRDALGKSKRKKLQEFTAG